MNAKELVESVLIERKEMKESGKRLVSFFEMDIESNVDADVDSLRLRNGLRVQRLGDAVLEVIGE